MSCARYMNISTDMLLRGLHRTVHVLLFIVLVTSCWLLKENVRKKSEVRGSRRLRSLDQHDYDEYDDEEDLLYANTEIRCCALY